MTTEIELLRNWLQKRYLQELNLSLGEDNYSHGDAIWVRDSATEVQCAELLDRELGIWIRFRCLATQTPLVDILKYVEHDVQWGLKSMASLTRRSGLPPSEVDAHGAWQIHLVWLVHEQHRDSWCKAMHDLRRQSGYSEELGLDVVFYEDINQLSEALEGHKLPQLLMYTRKLLDMKSADVETWTSANADFAKALKKLPLSFSNSAENEIAQHFVSSVLQQQDSVSSTEPGASAIPKKPNCLTIANFRNIEQAELRFSSQAGDGTDITVVHGPNGTGKSSIFEALCLGVTGVSVGLADYLKDADLTSSEKAQYVERVVKRFNSNSPATILLDDRDGLQDLARTSEDARRARIDADGTLLAQEDAKEWVRESSSTLGARILSGYSTLAQVAQMRIDSEYQKANQLRQDWLRKFGLSAQITKRETRLQKLALYLITQQLPRAPQYIEDWLQTVSVRIPRLAERAQKLSANWTRIDSTTEREELSLRIANAERLGFGSELLVTWIDERLNIIQSINALIGEQRSELEMLAANLPDIAQDLELWCKWLATQAQADTNTKAATVNLHQEDHQQISQLTKQLADLTETGRQLRMQSDHLDAISREPLPRWAETHPHTCPTCNSEHAQGILRVVDQLRSQIGEKIVELRKGYAEKQQLLKQLRTEQATVGQCPLSAERQKQLADWLHFPLDGPESLGALLAQPQYKERLIASLQRLITVPSLIDLEKMCSPATAVAKQVFDLVSQEDAKGEALWPLPERWAQIKKSVDEVALKIVREHLPLTLESVWRELVFFLTPARWNVAGEPRLKTDLSRGDQKLRVVIEPQGKNKDNGKGLLARYAFNQAEQHILGMAWFFTRYLTHGRFRHALIALDDPAQEMDQTTYRALVRWLQVLARLHSVKNIPMSLVTFLHQEDRALDLARATCQQVTMLQWARTLRTHGPNSTVNHLILRNDEQKPSLPSILRATVTS